MIKHPTEWLKIKKPDDMKFWQENGAPRTLHCGSTGTHSLPKHPLDS